MGFNAVLNSRGLWLEASRPYGFDRPGGRASLLASLVASTSCETTDAIWGDWPKSLSS